jgi:hypothetical protein
VRYHRFFAGELFHLCKYYQGGELKQETAQCRNCRNKLMGGYSQESLDSQKQLWSSIDRSARFEISANSDLDRSSVLTSTCILCGLGKEEAPAYCEYAYCEGEEIVFFVHPMMICHKCLIRLFDALSEKTKDQRRRFYEEHYGFPPDLMSRDRIDISIYNILG